MTGVAVLLVVISAFAHASWNLLAKRAEHPELANWWMATSGAVVMMPVAVVLLVLDMPEPTGWAFIAGTIALHILYFFTLGRAYKYGDLSIVYPVARGLGLTLIPVFGVFLLSETVSVQAALGIALIFAGIVTVGLSTKPANLSGADGSNGGLKSKVADRGVLFAIATGIVIASYSVLDKRGVEHVTPVLYMSFLTFGGSLGALGLIHRSYSREQFANEMRTHWRTLIAGGLLQFLAYVLVLTAFQLSRVSYVGPFRELAIGIGVVLGAMVLREHVTRWRAIGAGSVTLGAIAIAFAP